jgi:hypothetical protein
MSEEQLREELSVANGRIQYLDALLLRWNRAVTKFSPIAGSEYIDDPERSLKAIQEAARCRVGVEHAACVHTVRALVDSQRKELTGNPLTDGIYQGLSLAMAALLERSGKAVTRV